MLNIKILRFSKKKCNLYRQGRRKIVWRENQNIEQGHFFDWIEKK